MTILNKEKNKIYMEKMEKLLLKIKKQYKIKSVKIKKRYKNAKDKKR